MARDPNQVLTHQAPRRTRGMTACAAVLSLSTLMGAQSHEGAVEQRLLAAHNRERAALDVPALRWSADLARGAAQWSQHLASANRMQHADGGAGGSGQGESGQGENIWMGTAGRFAPESMVGAWLEEKAHFTRGTFPRVSRTGSWADVGHYTQMVWRDTSAVGCAVARGRQADVLVCRYAKPGNVVGHVPF